MKLFRLLCIVLLIGGLILLSGCWNYREIEALQIVTGIAIDKGKTSKYHMTFEYVRSPQTEAPGSQLAIIETQGETIFDAVREALSYTKNKLYFSNSKVLIISKYLAQEGILPLFDWFIRDAEPRLTNDLMISSEKTASEILKLDVGQNEIVAYNINNMVLNSQKYWGKSVNVSICQALDMLQGEGMSLVLPIIRICTSHDNATPQLFGTAVFKGDKMIGTINENETRSLLYLKNQIKDGAQVTNVGSPNNNISLEISRGKTRIKPNVQSAIPSFNIDIYMEGIFIEENSAQPVFSKYGLDAIEKHAAISIREGASALIKKAQEEFGSDIFGLGRAVYHRNPGYWKTYGPRWDTIFKSINVDVSAKVYIADSSVANPPNYK